MPTADRRALVYEDVPVAGLGPGEVLLRQHAIGVNFIDIYYRTGLYKLPSLPATLGFGRGRRSDRGRSGGREVQGRRQSCLRRTDRAYAEVRLVAADRLVKLPDGIAYETAAAMLLQGMTVRYLLRETYRVDSGTTMVVPRCCRRCWPHRVSMGACSRRNDHRNGEFGSRKRSSRRRTVART